MKILLLIPPAPTGVEYHRLIVPHARLHEHGIEVHSIASLDHTPSSFFQDYDIVVASRALSRIKNDIAVHQQIKKAGCKIVIDTDDHWILPAYHPLYQYWTKEKRAHIVCMNLKWADAVTCTTEHLKSLVSPLNPKTHVLRNTIDLNQPQFQPSDQSQFKTGRVDIGWAGSVVHEHDLSIIAGAIRQIHLDADLQGKYRMLLAGFREEPIWQRYEDIFTDKMRLVDEGAYDRINSMDIYSYAKCYDIFDVALIPLRETEFNKAKSELKLLEAGAKRKPAIVSDVYPYINIANNKNSIVASKKDWYKSVKKLIQSEAMREDLANQLFIDTTTQYNFSNELQKRIDLYKSLV